MLEGIPDSANHLFLKHITPNQSQPSVAINITHASQDSGATRNVTLSLKAQVLNMLENLEATPSLDEAPDWRAVFDRTHAPQEGLFARLDKQIYMHGANAELLQQPPASEDPQRLEMAQRAVQYKLGLSDNPLAGLPRQTLANITYDESGTYTAAERYSASIEIQKRDSTFWKSVYAEMRTESNFNGQASGQLLLARTKLEMLPSLHPAEQTTKDYLASSLQYQLLSAQRNELKVPEPLIYDNLKAPSGTAIAVVSQHGASSWQSISLEWLMDQQHVKASISFGSLLTLLDEPGKEPLADRVSPDIAACWVSISTQE
ncbi:hypothetical protein D9M71_237120 [compost metagenome]